MTVTTMIRLLICCLCLVATQVSVAESDSYELLERFKAERRRGLLAHFYSMRPALKGIFEIIVIAQHHCRKLLYSWMDYDFLRVCSE